MKLTDNQKKARLHPLNAADAKIEGKSFSLVTLLFGLGVLLGVLVVFYLSWLPQPNIGAAGFVPTWLADWADVQENDTIRTGVPFLLMGILAGIWHLVSRHGWYWWMRSWIFLSVVVVTAEVGQLFLDKRSFDWIDIVWGATGALFGHLLAGVVWGLIKGKRGS